VRDRLLCFEENSARIRSIFVRDVYSKSVSRRERETFPIDWKTIRARDDDGRRASRADAATNNEHDFEHQQRFIK
jgi:hypothetical protein